MLIYNIYIICTYIENKNVLYLNSKTREKLNGIYIVSTHIKYIIYIFYTCICLFILFTYSYMYNIQCIYRVVIVIN